jgi:guanylate kinase
MMGRASNRGKTRRGLMYVLSSPSGAGKTTLSRQLLKSDPWIFLSVSVTTREKRPGERNGRDYFFIDKKKFMTMKRKGELLEWAQVFGNYYGTPRKPIAKALASGRDVLFDVDWQGTQQLRKTAPSDVVSVFILPPSVPQLEKRLRTRAQDSKSVIRQRMSKASGEMRHWIEYDYVIINRRLSVAFSELQAILLSERLKRERQPGLSTFVRKLQSQLRRS